MPSSVSTRTSRTSMLVTARSRSRGVAPSMTIGSVTTRVSTRVIFMARVCYTAAPAARRRLVALSRRVTVARSRRGERAIHGGRAPGQTMEHHREVAARAKAHGPRDGVDRQLTFEQERARPVDPASDDEAVRRQARALPE